MLPVYSDTAYISMKGLRDYASNYVLTFLRTEGALELGDWGPEYFLSSRLMGKEKIPLYVNTACIALKGV